MNSKADYPVDENGIPITVLVPRHGQVIVAPWGNGKRSLIEMPEGQMSQILYEKRAIVLAVGPGSMSRLSAERAEMDLQRGDIVLLCCSDQAPDGSMEVSDPASPCVMLAVDEQAIVARVDRGFVKKANEKAMQKAKQ